MSVILQRRDLRRGQVRVDIRIEADLNMSAFVARQKVTGYVAGDKPSPVVDGERFLWRVPVYLAVLPQERLGQVGTIDVDAQTGQLLVTKDLIEEMYRDARTLVERPSA
jgi:hypothetical protein